MGWKATFAGAGRSFPLANKSHYNLGVQCPQVHQEFPIYPHPNL